MAEERFNDATFPRAKWERAVHEDSLTQSASVGDDLIVAANVHGLPQGGSRLLLVRCTVCHASSLVSVKNVWCLGSGHLVASVRETASGSFAVKLVNVGNTPLTGTAMLEFSVCNF